MAYTSFLLLLTRAFVFQPSLEAQVDTLFAPYAETPGAAVIVVHGGEQKLCKGYGIANMRTKAAITPTTVFDLASVSKQFTAMAVLILSEKNKLSLDDPVTQYLPELPSWAAKVTVKNLLTHTGGFPDYMYYFTRRGIVDGEWPRESRNKDEKFEPLNEDIAKLMGTIARPEFAPGERFEYSNTGYALLALIVQRASGQRFSDYLSQNIFRPLGMTQTRVLDDKTKTVRNRAISYMKKGGMFAPIDYTPLNLIVGDGNVNTTVGDMAKWDAALYTTKLISKKLMEAAYTPLKLKDGSQQAYGFGWQLGTWNGYKIAEHGGGWVGFRTHILRVPSQGFLVVVLSNNASLAAGPMARKIGELVLPKKP